MALAYTILLIFLMAVLVSPLLMSRKEDGRCIFDEPLYWSLNAILVFTLALFSGYFGLWFFFFAWIICGIGDIFVMRQKAKKNSEEK